MPFLSFSTVLAKQCRQGIDNAVVNGHCHSSNRWDPSGATRVSVRHSYVACEGSSGGSNGVRSGFASLTGGDPSVDFSPSSAADQHLVVCSDRKKKTPSQNRYRPRLAVYKISNRGPASPRPHARTAEGIVSIQSAFGCSACRPSEKLPLCTHRQDCIHRGGARVQRNLAACSWKPHRRILAKHHSTTQRHASEEFQPSHVVGGNAAAVPTNAGLADLTPLVQGCPIRRRGGRWCQPSVGECLCVTCPSGQQWSLRLAESYF